MEEKTRVQREIPAAIGTIERITEAAQILNQEALTPAGAARRLGVGRSAISNWISRGQVRAAIAGGLPFIPLREVERLEKVIAGEQKHTKEASHVREEGLTD